jgi:fumarylacetoacetase
MNTTNDPSLRSFVPVPPESHFPIQNLPYGTFRKRSDTAAGVHVGVAIGDQVLDLTLLEEAGRLGNLLSFQGERAFDTGFLESFLALSRAAWSEARAAISRLLRADEPTLRDNSALREKVFVPIAEAEMLLPVRSHNYTDFYSSREHATNVGTMLRGPDKALMPNWLYLPVAYHGRASSLVVSGTDVRRPRGQSKPEGAEAPVFGPTKSLDFELELATVIGAENSLGTPIPIGQTDDYLFGMVLLNDWSARDIQAWEYVPLGPFLAKNFCTSISPWVVPFEALEPFRTAGPVQDPEPLPYLRTQRNQVYDIRLEVYLQGEKMDSPRRVSATNARFLYWNIAQQLAHHTVNGCNLEIGDLLATGTISGPTPDSYGSLLELAWRGARPLAFPNGEQRSFLLDGDRVTMTGWCQGNGYRVGFGEVTGKVLPAWE